MTIAIDYDGTWTRAPWLWRRLYFSCFGVNHTMIMVTGRSGWSDDMERGNIPETMRIIYTGGKMKEAHCRSIGVTVDVWIDDMPGMIQDCRILADNMGDKP